MSKVHTECFVMGGTAPCACFDGCGACDSCGNWIEIANEQKPEPVESKDCEPDPEVYQCLDCGALGPHHCGGVPGGFSDNESD